MVDMKLILASGSKYRKRLLERLIFPISIQVPNIAESPNSNENPALLVKRLSIEKAQIISDKFPEHWVIGSDQAAQLGERILGKPGSHDVAVQQLKSCSGEEVQFITGTALVHSNLEKNYYAVNVVHAKFLKLSAQMINNYLNADKPYDCAGSFKIESLGISLFEWVKSDDPTSLEGLPLITVCKLLRQAGIEPLD